jgi:hypothetical protein
MKVLVDNTTIVMEHHISPGKVALTFGAFAGGAHIIWSALVALGWAQPLVDFISWAHMITPTFIVEEFDVLAASTLIVVASIVGYAVGRLFAHVWNWAHRA